MARPGKQHPFDVLMEHAAELLAGGLSGVIGAAPARGAARKGTTAGRKIKRDMTCRVPGCKNPSGGPYWGYICEEHRKKLSKKQQQEARDAYKAG